LFGRNILGLKLDNLSLVEAAETVLRHCQTVEAPLLHVITLNPEMVVTAQRDQDFATIVNRAGLVVPDGVGVVWGAQKLGYPSIQKVPGIELVEQILALATCAGERKLRVYLLGAKLDVVEDARRRAELRYPGVVFCGAHHGYFTAEDSETIVAQVNAAEPDLLLVGLGSPRQEYWIAEHAKQLNCRAAIGIGGVFDVWAGRVERAPLFLRRLGLEWLYRLVKQPSRLPRMMALPRFVILVYRRRIQMKGEEDD